MPLTMRPNLIPTLPLLFILPSCASLAQAPDARQRITQLADETSLLRPGTQPWHLAMTFDLYDLAGKKKESGIVEEWWVSPTQRRLVITSPSFNRTIPTPSGDLEPVANREAVLVSNLVDQVVNPIPHFAKDEELSVDENPRQFGNATLTCLSVSRRLPASNGKMGLDPGPVICLTPGSDTLRLIIDNSEGKAIIRNTVGSFRGTNVALHSTVDYYGKPAIDGKITTLETYDPTTNPVALTTDDRSPERVAGAVLAGKIIKKVPPTYPPLAKRRQIGGTVIFAALVGRDGKIHSLDVVSSPDGLLSDAALDAVKQWQYQPVLLNGQPTQVDTTITVHFNLNP